MQWDMATMLAIIATVISVISLALSIYDFYLRRKDRQPRIQILAEMVGSVSNNKKIRHIHIYILNLGEKPAFINSLTLEPTPTKNSRLSLKRNHHPKISNTLSKVRKGSFQPYSEVPQDQGHFIMESGSISDKPKYLLSLGPATPVLVDPGKPTEIVHTLSPREEEYIASYIANRYANCAVIAHDGTLNTYKSNPIRISEP